MALDLCLMPIQHTSSNWWLCYNRLSFNRDYNLFGIFCGGRVGCANDKLINKLPLPTDKNVDVYLDDGLKRTKENDYGDKLTYFMSQDLKNVNVPSDEWNDSIMTFLRALPHNTPVVIWWS